MNQAFPKRWRAFIGISSLGIVVFLDLTIVNAVLPGIQRDPRASVDPRRRDVVSAHHLRHRRRARATAGAPCIQGGGAAP